jgi:hypothetical protein
MSRAKIIIAAGTLWSSLGFTRGVQHYNYQTNKRKEQFYYSSALGYGIGGVFVYVNPVVCLINVSKELYRLEVNLRDDLKHEKDTDVYKLIF